MRGPRGQTGARCCCAPPLLVSLDRDRFKDKQSNNIARRERQRARSQSSTPAGLNLTPVFLERRMGKSPPLPHPEFMFFFFPVVRTETVMLLNALFVPHLIRLFLQIVLHSVKKRTIPCVSHAVYSSPECLYVSLCCVKWLFPENPFLCAQEEGRLPEKPALVAHFI